MEILGSRFTMLNLAHKMLALLTMNANKRFLKIAGFLFFINLAFVGALNAQKITYSEPEREDNRRTNFEIIGRIIRGDIQNKTLLFYKIYPIKSGILPTRQANNEKNTK